jgi:hypothetical protein
MAYGIHDLTLGIMPSDRVCKKPRIIVDENSVLFSMLGTPFIGQLCCILKGAYHEDDDKPPPLVPAPYLYSAQYDFLL